MFTTHIARASLATHAGCLALLSDLSEGHCGVRRRLHNTNLAALRVLRQLHSRSAGLPFMGPWLSFDPSVWMSHSTGHVVQTEEAPFAVAGHQVLLPNTG